MDTFSNAWSRTVPEYIDRSDDVAWMLGCSLILLTIQVSPSPKRSRKVSKKPISDLQTQTCELDYFTVRLGLVWWKAECVPWRMRCRFLKSTKNINLWIEIKKNGWKSFLARCTGWWRTLPLIASVDLPSGRLAGGCPWDGAPTPLHSLVGIVNGQTRSFRINLTK